MTPKHGICDTCGGSGRVPLVKGEVRVLVACEVAEKLNAGPFSQRDVGILLDRRDRHSHRFLRMQLLRLKELRLIKHAGCTPKGARMYVTAKVEVGL